MEAHISYHVSDDGNPRQCYAPPGECPLAKKMGMPSLPHFNNINEARSWYEKHREEDIFPTVVSPGLLVNNLDDAFGVERLDDDGKPLADGRRTFAENEAIGAMMEAEESIKDHQMLINQGKSPYQIYDTPRADMMAQGSIDWKAYKDAFLNGDYDKARLIHARAVADSYEVFGTIYMSPEELVEEVR